MKVFLIFFTVLAIPGVSALTCGDAKNAYCVRCDDPSSQFSIDKSCVETKHAFRTDCCQQPQEKTFYKPRVTLGMLYDDHPDNVLNSLSGAHIRIANQVISELNDTQVLIDIIQKSVLCSSSRRTESVAAANEAVDAGAHVLIGPLCSGDTEAIATQVAAPAKTVMLSHGSTLDALAGSNEYLYRTIAPDSGATANLAAEVASRGIMPVAMTRVGSNNVSESFAGIVRDTLLANHGITLVADITHTDATNAT